jgi:hypothetical protein
MKSKRYSWRTLLRDIPFTTWSRGHVIITTAEEFNVKGPKIINFEDSGREMQAKSTETPWTLEPATGESQRAMKDWWRGRALQWERLAVRIILFLSDERCPCVPHSFLTEILPDSADMSQLTAPGFRQGNGYTFPLNSVLSLGPALLSRLEPGHQETTTTTDLELGPGTFPNAEMEIVRRVWTIIDKCVYAVDQRPGHIFTWHSETKMAQNISAAWRRCSERRMPGDMLSMLAPGSWKLSAMFCEAHGEYTTAAALYNLERTRHTFGDLEHLDLLLDSARAYQWHGDLGSAQAQLKKHPGSSTCH